MNPSEPTPQPEASEPSARLRLSEMMSDASIDQLVALDTDLRVRAWNKACEEATGIPEAAAVGKRFDELHPGAENFPEIAEALRQALAGFKSFLPWEKCAYARYYEHHFVPLRDEEQVVGVLIIIHDVAHRVKAEIELKNLNRALAQKNRELQQKNEEIGHFNWIASHDLKEPLRKIYTFIEMVATREGIKLTDAARSNLRRAQSAVQRLGLLTDDIVNFSQVAVPGEQLSELSLQEIFEQALAENKASIQNDEATVHADALPVILGYANLLRLLFRHMLGNALKFHEEGARPEVQVRYAYMTAPKQVAGEENTDAHYHRISFQDNGIGFDTAFSDRIFGLFQRLHPQGIYRGTGMGLPICKKVVEAHQGFITVESEPGEGSTFHCWLKDLRGAEAL